MSKLILSLLLAVITFGDVFSESNLPLPFGLTEDQLNLVYSASNGPETENLYGKILDLKRIPNVILPGERLMIRYLAGDTELKFIIKKKENSQIKGGRFNARGIRQLTILLPKEKRAGIITRMRENGMELPEFSDENIGLIGSSRFEIRDYDDNQIELIFLDEESPGVSFKQAQIGLGVSNMDKMGAFLNNILGLEPIETKGSVHRYVMGLTQIKFWDVPISRPTWVGKPNDIVGMTMVQFVVDDVRAARDIIVARGGKIHTEPYVIGNLAIVMFVEGPDGILFEFGESLVK